MTMQSWETAPIPIPEPEREDEKPSTFEELVSFFDEVMTNDPHEIAHAITINRDVWRLPKEEYEAILLRYGIASASPPVYRAEPQHPSPREAAERVIDDSTPEAQTGSRELTQAQIEYQIEYDKRFEHYDANNSPLDAQQIRAKIEDEMRADGIISPEY